jgi:hypothetical protein
MSDDNLPFFDNAEKMIGWLESKGAVEWVGVDENGEATFSFDLDVLKEVYPPLYEDVMKDIDQDLMNLYELGLIEIEYDENLNANFRLSEEGKKAIDSIKNMPPFLD